MSEYGLLVLLIYLRFSIYGYLLDSKYTKIRRANPNRMSYKFHTQILLVNRCTHDEAEQCLHEHNNFVIFCHQPTANNDALMPPWVPLVAELGTRSMKYFSLEITLLLNCEIPHARTTVEAWILLATDLEMLCSAIDFYVCRDVTERQAQTPMLLFHHKNWLQDHYVDNAGHPLRPHYLSLEFRSNRFHRAKSKFQSYVVSRFRPLSRSGLHVEICGHLVQTPELRAHRLSATPSLVCASSLAWRIFWHADSLKELADCSAQNGELELADFIYNRIWTGFRDAFWKLEPPLDVADHIRNLLVDIALTSAYLHVTSKYIPSCAERFLDVLHINRSMTSSDPVLSRILYVRMLAVAISGSSFWRFPNLTIADCIAKLTITGSDSHQLHDAELLSECPDHSKRLRPDDLPIHSCSAYALPPNFVNLRKAGLAIKSNAVLASLHPFVLLSTRAMSSRKSQTTSLDCRT